ncbi:hypothetical protein [Nocardioides sp. CER19]|uniref:hypothetical protein n=1 Tax=Nocardioides sp. CER19 TaxID=3038538 RepID=UPI0024477919|nr:hypothetical protein [Nocardioides sp. CER19]MDH2413945.1 hypothetical protein [Nocardioides sp. CER19]
MKAAQIRAVVHEYSTELRALAERQGFAPIGWAVRLLLVRDAEPRLVVVIGTLPETEGGTESSRAAAEQMSRLVGVPVDLVLPEQAEVSRSRGEICDVFPWPDE